MKKQQQRKTEKSNKKNQSKKLPLDRSIFMTEDYLQCSNLKV